MKMATYELIKKLNGYPVFTLEHVSALTGKDTDYIKVYLKRLERRGIVHSLQRNRYTVQEDPLIVSTSIIWPSYVSIWYALRYHGLTEQLPGTIDVLTTSSKSRRRIDFQGSTLLFTTIPSRYLFGYTKIEVSGFNVFMADPEKAIIDSVVLRRISLSEVFDVLKNNIDRLSSGRIIEHCLRMKNRSAMKRIGWMLEELGIPGIEVMKKNLYRTRIPLDYSLPSGGSIDPEWGIINNMSGGQ